MATTSVPRRDMTSATIVPAESQPLARRPVTLLSAPLGPDGSLVKYASVLMPDEVQDKGGVRGEAVMGRFRDAAGPLAPENFVQNRDFVRFLQGVIAQHAAQCPPLAAEAQRIKSGHVYVLDGRRDPSSQPLPEDILGTALVADGRVQAYEPAPAYAVFTKRGFMVLEDWLHARLVEALLALPVAKITLAPAPE